MQGNVSARRSRLIQRFRERALKAIDAAALASRAAEFEQVRRELHKIKGDARMLQLSSLAKYVDELHEQTLDSAASSSLARGLTQLREWVQQPLVEDEHARERLTHTRLERTRSEPPARAGQRVLVVDDSPVMRMILAACLRARGLEVETFPCGEQTLAAIAERRPQVILSDVEMPGLGGLQLLERVRATNPNLPVVLLTGDVGEEQRRRAEELGAAGLFCKSADLAPVVEQVLRQCDGANAPRLECS